MDVKVFGRKRTVCVNRKITVEARVQQVQEKTSAPCTRFTSRSNAAKIGESSHAHTNMLFLPRKCEKFVKCPVSNSWRLVVDYTPLTVINSYFITNDSPEQIFMINTELLNTISRD